MDFSEEAIREERERLSFNHPGFNYPLMHRWIKKSDTLEMARVIRRSAHHLKGFINWAQYAPTWDFKQIQKFVNDHADPEPPRMHLVFLLGKQIVGMGSLAPMENIDEIQISLWVAEGFHSRGIGSRIAATMEMYAFEVWGYSKLYYQCDANNEQSKRLPQKLGFRYSHTFSDKISAQNESGFWFSFVKDRPTDLPPAIFQGADIEQFTKVRHKI
jgi:RimJ/RimL family protein N-acetyltransferase